MNIRTIRNFSIIAHIDHGKSTLADRLLEITGTVDPRKMSSQFLDNMELEKERGITIKAQTVRMNYQADDGENYIINLIDTPGHVDFTYEVSRSLSVCEGAILVVDAAQGVEAQTLSNVYLALENNLEIFPVINKIDLPNALPEKVKAEIENMIGLEGEDALLISAKEGKGIKEVIEEIIRKIPPPRGSGDLPLKALVFDSWFDSYHGVVALVRIFEGKINSGMKIKLFSSNKVFEISQVGVFSPQMRECSGLSAGEVGYIAAGIKNISDIRIGDTITGEANPTARPFPGFKDIKPMVFCALYPTQSIQYEILKVALDKLSLNDSSFSFEPESSLALGFGFRCGFLGLLHLDIIHSRLEREYNLNLITTSPTVAYQVVTKKGETIRIENPTHLPSPQDILRIEEPYILASFHLPPGYLGAVVKLCEEKRGMQKKLQYITENRVNLVYELPLSEVIFDFYDRLKSLTRGYGSMDYEYLDFRESDLVKLDLLINGDAIDALTSIVPRKSAYSRGRTLAEKLRKTIPRQLFEVIIQAAIGSRIIARERIVPLKKNVTAKCYGGDITRKRKLWEKQKEGKKRSKQIGKIDIPQEAFLSVLKLDK